MDKATSYPFASPHNQNHLLSSFVQLAQQSALWQRDKLTALHNLLSSIAHHLQLQSAEVWLNNQDNSGLYLETRYSDHDVPTLETSTIPFERHARFFQQIRAQAVVTLDNLNPQDNGTPFSENGPGAYILVSLLKEGRFIGVASFRHADNNHVWQGEETQYLLAATGLIAPILIHNHLHDSEQLYQSLFNNLSDAAFILVENYFADCNPAALEMFGCKHSQIVGQTPYKFSPLRQTCGRLSSEKAMEKISSAFSGRGQSFEWRHMRLDGSEFDAEVTLSSVKINDVPHVLAIVRDIDERKKREAQIHKIMSLQKAMFNAASYGIFSINLDGIIQTFNKAAERMLGYQAHEVVDIHSPEIFHDPIESVEFSKKIARFSEEFIEPSSDLFVSQAKYGQIEEYEWSCMTKEGKRFPAHLSLSALREENGEITGYLGILSDITETKRAQEDLIRSKQELEYRANHDSLTGLPNRSRLHDAAKQAIQLANVQGHQTALLLLDLDRFKEVNDTLGHYAGDLLLQTLGNRLWEIVKAHQAQLYRLGGDEFAILIPAVKTTADAVNVGDIINNAVRRPIEIEGVSLELSGSIGLACFPVHGDNSDSLLRCADVAMYRAKSSATGTIVYDPCLDSHTPRRLAIMSELGKAIREEQLILYFQPRVDLETNLCVGCEALIRWQHPTLGLIEPEEFIPLAEMSDLIRPLSMWVLRSALHHARLWLRSGLEICVAVNLSARNLLDNNYPEYIKQLLNEYQVPPHLLDIEITESAIMSDPDRSIKVVNKIHELGVSLAIDDFGTGYSSLSYLKRLPVQLLKIDRSFVQDLIHDEQDAAIVRSTIGLAHSFGLKVVAEGVEDFKTLQELRALGCEYGQGYYFKYPVPGPQFRKWLEVQDFEDAAV